MQLVRALRLTAARLEQGATYEWSHFANCNCGNLAQTITGLSPGTIYRAAFARAGDWGEQALEYCPSSGLPMDMIFDAMIGLGMEPRDVKHLERLSDPDVLRTLPEGHRVLRYTERDDVVLYMRRWAELLEARLGPAEVDESGEREAA
jgi:hypothetical protein